METTYGAARIVTRLSLDMLREALVGLPDAAAEWKPLPTANSLNVLVVHSLTSSRFFLGCGAGRALSRRQYLESDRVAAFEARGLPIAALVSAIDAAAAEFDALLAAAPADALAATVAWPDYPEERYTGAECVIRAIAHLREHVGQVQLMRDLWLARSAS
jgi:hypothetical protein